MRSAPYSLLFRVIAVAEPAGTKKAECVGGRKTNCWFWGNKQLMVVSPLWKGLEGSQRHAHPSLLLLQHPSGQCYPAQ